MTQTDPITLKAKQEEIKDGVKGAPTPSMVFYGHESFMVDPPYEEKPEMSFRINYESLDLEEQFPEADRLVEEETEYWWEQEPAAAEEPKEEEGAVSWWGTE